MIFFVESSAISYCPVCGEPLSYRDSCVRIMRLEGGIKRRFLIRRLKCCNCGKLHRELPDCLAPYKHYASEVISGAICAEQRPLVRLPAATRRSTTATLIKVFR